jgi:hypothetical protein
MGFTLKMKNCAHTIEETLRRAGVNTNVETIFQLLIMLPTLF